MEKYLNVTSIAFGSIGGILAYTLGGWDQLLWVLLYFMVADYITGLFKAYKTQTLSSQLGFNGIIKKVVMFFLIAAANMITPVLGEVGVTLPLREVVICTFIANEGLSLLENAALFVDIPESLKNALLQIRNKGDK